MSEANKAAIRRWYEEGINKGNTDLIDALLAPDIVWHGPGGRELRGRAALKEMVAMYLAAFPDMRVSVEDQVAEGDKVVTRFTGRGTHKGDLEGVAPTGNPISVTGISIDRFEGGKLVEEWENFDELAMMQQIGAVPAAAEA